MFRKEVIVFDWDGTLADSGPAVFRAIRRLIEECQYPVLTEEQILQNLGLSMKDFARKMLKVDETELPLFLKRFYAFFEEEEKKSEILYPDAMETLNYFKQNGYNLAIATNRIRERLNKALQLTKLGDFFNYSVTADEALDKPKPLMMDFILNAFGADKTDVWMIGDSIYDAAFANNAGVRCVIIDRNFYNQEVFSAYRDLKLLPNLKALIDEIK